MGSVHSLISDLAGMSGPSQMVACPARPAGRQDRREAWLLDGMPETPSKRTPNVGDGLGKTASTVGLRTGFKSYCGAGKGDRFAASR